MKTDVKRKCGNLSLFSLAVLGLFIWMAADSGSSEKVLYKRVIGNGEVEIVYDLHDVAAFGSGDSRKKVTGKVNDKGNWEGTVKTEYSANLSDPRNYVESAEFVNGERHGETIRKYESGKIEVEYYEMGKLIGPNKAAHISMSDSTAFDIVKHEYPWHLASYLGCGYTEAFVKDFIDSIEAKTVQTADLKYFDDYYDDAVEDVEKIGKFGTIKKAYKFFTELEGLERIKKNQLRLATIDHFRSGKSTYRCVETTYPGYLTFMNTKNVTNPEFERFCQILDSMMVSNGPLTVTDPFFTDSVDVRMYRVLTIIVYSSLKSAPLSTTLKSADLFNNDFDIRRFARSTLDEQGVNAFPRDVAYYEARLLEQEFNEADVFRMAVKKACSVKKRWINLPAVTTIFWRSNSTTSADLRGNVISSGGANVTARGIVWAATYNPTVADNKVASGTGEGEFVVTINGFTPGKSYFARAYATNSAGTAYGNILPFTSTDVKTTTEEIVNSGFTVYPNPASGSVTFSYFSSSTKDLEFQIVNANGLQVCNNLVKSDHSGLRKMTIDLSHLQNGIYTCRLTGSAIHETQKLLIVH